MKKIFIVLLMTLSIPVNATSSHRVRGYVKRDGTYVAPHRQTNSNHTQRDNWSSVPNTNPYTGKRGSKLPRY
jgi:hypothetical protein